MAIGTEATIEQLQTAETAYTALIPDSQYVDPNGNLYIHAYTPTEEEKRAVLEAMMMTERTDRLGYRYTYEERVVFAIADRFSIEIPIERKDEDKDENRDDSGEEQKPKYETREVVRYEVLPTRQGERQGEVGFRDELLRYTRTVNRNRAHGIEMAIVSTGLDFSVASGIDQYDKFSRQIMALAQLLQLGQIDRAVVLGPDNTSFYMILRDEEINAFSRGLNWELRGEYHQNVNQTMLQRLADIFTLFTYDDNTRRQIDEILMYKTLGYTRQARALERRLPQRLKDISRRLTPQDTFYPDNLLLSVAQALAKSGIFILMPEQAYPQGIGSTALEPAA